MHKCKDKSKKKFFTENLGFHCGFLLSVQGKSMRQHYCHKEIMYCYHGEKGVALAYEFFSAKLLAIH